MTPQEAHRVVELNRNDTSLGVWFFKWACRQSTYCYHVDSRIRFLNLIVSSGLFGVAHNVIIELIKESRGGEGDILKLMDALDGLRGTGFRMNYPCYSSLMMGLAKADLGFLTFLVYRRMVDDGFVGGIDYRTLINALCKSGFLLAGEMFLCRFLKFGFDLDIHVCTSLVLLAGEMFLQVA
ncbi:hypothetical protein Tsubulata_049709 [Turnera subulata]|uniref:Pentatricopeptide repeat-containing protein n=1 Tax=Turnera subulata TaxID=218843 RepID=A0A9Q0FQ22_9ROSI|nr:hypothetical protein Tsubulata_049709 [Turnera subulata]